MDATMSLGKLLGIAIRSKSRAPMNEIRSCEITCQQGLVGDFRGRPGSRQVTVLAIEAWRAATRELERDLDWTTRRANLLVGGIALETKPDAILQIGGVVLQIHGECDPCGRMDESAAGLRNALRSNWRGGVCCQVLSGGTIQVGDAVELREAPPEA